MGHAVRKLVKKRNSDFVLSASAPPVSAFDNWNEKKISGVVDFSAPDLFSVALRWCLENGKPFVSGTTALSGAQKRLLKTASKTIPVFYEENMSWGIWQIKSWIRNLSRYTSDILLEDIHHKNKKDKPSGTALKLQRNFPSFAQRKLKIKSIRKGREFGTHRIVFRGPEELVVLEHKALSRCLFAGGALRALQWVIKQPPGFYSFEDIYGK